MEPNPWEQQSGETSRQWRAFVAYRDLGPVRSIDKAAAVLKPEHKRSKRVATGRLFEWSAANRWVERAAAWDRHVAARAAEKEVRVREASVARAVRERTAALERVKKALTIAVKKGEKLLRFPVRESTVETPQNETPSTVVRPVNAGQIRTGTEIVIRAGAALLETLDAEIRATTGGPVPTVGEAPFGMLDKATEALARAANAGSRTALSDLLRALDVRAKLIDVPAAQPPAPLPTRFQVIDPDGHGHPNDDDPGHPDAG